MRTDLSYLNNLTGGSKPLIEEMVKIFEDQVSEFSDELNTLLKKEDWPALGKLAHKAKSSVAIMGMNELADDLKNLELLARESKETNTYKTTIEKFNKQCSEAIVELNNYINTL